MFHPRNPAKFVPHLKKFPHFRIDNVPREAQKPTIINSFRPIEPHVLSQSGHSALYHDHTCFQDTLCDYESGWRSGSFERICMQWGEISPYIRCENVKRDPMASGVVLLRPDCTDQCSGADASPAHSWSVALRQNLPFTLREMAHRAPLISHQLWAGYLARQDFIFLGPKVSLSTWSSILRLFRRPISCKDDRRLPRTLNQR